MFNWLDWLGKMLSRLLHLPGTLSDTDILRALKKGSIGITPFEPALLQRAGYAFRLGGTLKIPLPGQIINPMFPDEVAHTIVNLEDLTRNGMPEAEWIELFAPEAKLRKHGITRDALLLAARGPVPGRAFGYPLFPGEFLLGATLEQLFLDRRHKAKADGRSSAARKGLTVHQTAMNLWPGHGNPTPATVTLELRNVGPHVLILQYGYQVGNFVFERLLSEASETYGTNGRYSGQGMHPGTPVARDTDMILPA